jgi:hypothetical protein
MGDRERQDSLKVLEGKKILNIKRFRILDYILWPYRAYKNKQRQDEIRKKLFANSDEE